MKLLKTFFGPIEQIEEESVEFKVGFWKAVGIILLWQLIQGIIIGVASNIIDTDKHYIYMLIFDIIEIPIITLILNNTFGHMTWRKNTFKKFHKKDFLYLALVIVVFRLLYDAYIYPIIMLIPEGEVLKSAEELINNNVLYFIINACVIAPIIEEIVCRGVVLNGLLKKFSPILSIFISAFLFAFMHLNIHQGVNAFILGIIFGYIYYKTRSVYLTMFCHFVNNTIALFLYIPTSVIGIIINIIVSTAIAVPLIFLISKKLDLKYEGWFISTLPRDNINIYKDL